MQPNNSIDRFQETEEESPLADFLNKYLPYWPYFAILVIMGLTSAWLYLRYTSKVYETKATLLIKDDKKGAGGDLGPLQAFDLFGSVNSVENEAAILKSRTLMQEVVRNLHLYAPVFVTGRVQSHSGYASCPIRVESPFPDSIKSLKLNEKTEIPFTFSREKQLVTIQNKNYPLNTFIETPYGRLKFVINKNYELTKDYSSVSTIDYFLELRNVERTANAYIRNTTISTDNKSNVISLSIKDEVPQRGEDILNELLKVYNQASILDKNMLAGNTLKFVEDRLKFVSQELDSVEHNLQKFRSQNQITDITTQGQIYLQTVAENDQKLSEIDMQLAALDQVEKYVKTGGAVGGIVSISSMNIPNPAFTANIQKLAELELQYTQLKKTVPENNPQVQSLLDGINKLKPTIIENVSNQRKNLLASRNDLAQVNNGYNSLLRTVPAKERELLSISRQQVIKNDIYTFLLKKREETALSYASAVPDSRIIDKAQTSLQPVSPKRSLTYIIALILGLGIGFIIFYLKDLLSTTIQDRSEIETLTKMPILSEILYDDSKAAIVVADGKRSFIAEQFRQLRTSLGFMGLDEGHKKILLTSSISGEGKSFIAINLAISLSLIGKKVILLELDLRKPKLSDILTISRSVGVSNYLINKKTIEEIILESGIDNLSIITSGPLPPNPSELLSNGKMNQLLTKLETEFDYIIMDTAPIGPVTDAYILSPLSDITLFLVRYNYTPKLFVKKLEEIRKNKALKNCAIIYNGIRPKGIRGYGYGAYGKYGYGYGYTEERLKKKWWKFS